MCDCDCELPKQEKWRQIREQAFRAIGVDAVVVPGTGEHFVRDGKVTEISESELLEPGTDYWAWRIWTEPEGGDDD